MDLAPKRLPDPSYVKKHQAQYAMSHSFSSKSTQSRRKFKAIPNPANYKPQYTLNKSRDAIRQLHERNVKNYPELFPSEAARTPNGTKDEL